MASRSTVSVPATAGEPYEVVHWGHDLYIVRRTDKQGRNHSLLLARADAIALTNALIDVIEGET